MAARRDVTGTHPRAAGFAWLFLRSVLAYGVLPNLLFMALGSFVYLMRPWVNADYFLVAMAAPFVPGWFAFAAYAGLFANEVFINIAPLYHFQIVDAIRWLSELRYVSASVWVPAALEVVLLSLGVAWAASRLAPSRPQRSRPLRERLRLAAALFGVCFLVCAADIANGTSFLALPVHLSFIDANIAYSGIRRSVMSTLTLAESSAKIRYAPLEPAQSAAGALLAEARAGAIPGKPQLAVIVVESLGAFREVAETAQLLAPLTDPAIAARYDVKVSEVPFNGHTIEGEFRELCGVQLLSYGEQDFPTCLPAYLNALGYETTGLHGFTNQFYNRYHWYPKLGFDHILFAEEMQGMGVTERCGSGFRGICDSSVAELMRKQLLTPGKPQFVYWMTLNSHLPLDKQTPADDAFDCGTTITGGPCLHSRVIRHVLETVASVAADPKLPPTEFVVVGDHMPPFMTPRDRALYEQTSVPAIVLTPRVRAEAH